MLCPEETEKEKVFRSSKALEDHKDINSLLLYMANARRFRVSYWFIQ